MNDNFKRFNTYTYNLTGCGGVYHKYPNIKIPDEFTSVQDKLHEAHALLCKYRRMVEGFTKTDFIPKVAGLTVVLEHIGR